MTFSQTLMILVLALFLSLFLWQVDFEKKLSVGKYQKDDVSHITLEHCGKNEKSGSGQILVDKSSNLFEVVESDWEDNDRYFFSKNERSQLVLKPASLKWDFILVKNADAGKICMRYGENELDIDLFSETKGDAIIVDSTFVFHTYKVSKDEIGRMYNLQQEAMQKDDSTVIKFDLYAPNTKKAKEVMRRKYRLLESAELKGLDRGEIDLELRSLRTVFSEDVNVAVYADDNNDGLKDGEALISRFCSQLSKCRLNFSNISFNMKNPIQDGDQKLLTKSLIIETDKKVLFDSLDTYWRNEVVKEKFDRTVPLVNLENYYDVAMQLMDASEFVSRYPQFTLSDGERVILAKGKHFFEENVIVPRGVQVEIFKGANIFIAEGVSIVSYGKILAKGTQAEPITIQSVDEKPFGVFSLIGDGSSESIFDYVHVSNGSEITLNGIYFSGMFNAYHSDVEVKNSIFKDAKADDALNFKYANGVVSSSFFEGNFADAIDFDYMGGKIDGNFFLDNGNDSIDTSGSTTLIQNNRIVNSGDKCMSFGENSETTAINNILKGCKTGIECKDQTRSIIINNAIIGNEVGVNSYKKKDFFDSPRCEVHNSLFVKNGKDVTFENTFTEGIKKEDDVSELFIFGSTLSDENYSENGNNITVIDDGDLLQSKNFSSDKEIIENIVGDLYPDQNIEHINGIINESYIPKL